MNLNSIINRNQQVTTDKAWETSKTRKLIIAVITYFSALLFLYIINVPDPYLAALVPMGGFLLSTSNLNILKKIWIKKIYKK